ncbi:MAG: hypothetical protein AB7N76_10890 [Planctomycetota bacterium]
MDVKSLIEGAAEEKGWALTSPEEGVYLLSLQTKGDRTQMVYVVFRQDAGHDVALIWSSVGSASKFSDAWQLLDYNWSHTYGALARRGKEVVLKHSELVGPGDERALAQAIEHVGRTADALEEELYGALDMN